MQLRIFILLLAHICAETGNKPKKNVWKKSVGTGATKNGAKQVEKNEESFIQLPSGIQKAAELFAAYTDKPRKIATYYFKKVAKESKKLWKKFVSSGFSVEKLIATQIAALLVYTIISSFVKFITRTSRSRRENKLVKKVYVATPSHAVEESSSETENEGSNEEIDEEEQVEQESTDNSDHETASHHSESEHESLPEIRRTPSTQINRQVSTSNDE
ncbi:Oidioi.mRNA.OKI2018_I69.XSR.g14330.t1.cds [Oikopleura dioica]|uniref:Oidioi.mRNA.OKI2018_I69.XSR.g14330.t1.cds n=1 Tax=Oikopleura dioica TaxID=34765 RepID=A0ABN7SDD8_OIKDI|nr:Oidioi.mRNA.OKI2018_I69.XSR.g14330.t1.cds [Oikopleura dioica]